MGNFKEAKKYHFIYKTTCLLNNKYYIGMHSTSNLSDGYLGSGTHLRYAIRKHGKHNFKCEILEYLDNQILLAERERELVNETLLTDSLCMNLKPGGIGGYFQSHEKCVENGKLSRLRINFLLQNDLNWVQQTGKKISDGLKKAYLEGKMPKPKWIWTGKKHKEESKKKIGLANSKYKGCLNSQFGKCWITNGIESKKIYKGDLIPEGWRVGRIIIPKTLV